MRPCCPLRIALVCTCHFPLTAIRPGIKGEVWFATKNTPKGDWNKTKKRQSKKGKAINSAKVRKWCSWSTQLYSQAQQFLCCSTRVSTPTHLAELTESTTCCHSFLNTWGLGDKMGAWHACGGIQKVTEATWSPSLLQNVKRFTHLWSIFPYLMLLFRGQRLIKITEKKRPSIIFFYTIRQGCCGTCGRKEV